MSGTINDVIPGLKEAEDRYKAEQLEAFIGIEPSICGVILVEPFTAQMFVELDVCGNAVVHQRAISPADAAAFLWRTSPEYRRDDAGARQVFSALVANLPYDDVCSEIGEYLRRAWSGMPQFIVTKKSSGSVGTWMSFLIHAIAVNYGWTDEYILSVPFRRLWQYLNRIMEANNEKYREQCVEAMKIRSDWLLEQNASREEQK